MNVEIEFLEWVHPKAGVTKVEVEGGKPLMLKAKIKQEWVGLTDEEIFEIWKKSMFINNGKYAVLNNQPFVHFAREIEAKFKDKNK